MQIKNKNHILKIEQDENPDSPREWDNLGKLILNHREYTFPNELNINFKDFNSWTEVENHLRKEHKAIVILPIYLYNHSGLYIKVGNFYNSGLPQGHAYFDSGQIGFAVITKEDMKKEGLKFTPKDVEKAKKILTAEVEAYSKYVSGEVFGFSLIKVVKCDLDHEHEEHIDSCSGFYSVEDAINHALENMPKKQASEFKKQIDKEAI